ncbi:eukaryotic translation initiation factor 2-alpha kinase 1 isoform X1 [Corvus hawaiiensis]|uniref:eukaryotic translation initiation factor 2-alpha kinase 1 isoform X1 n=1 Tax=Corvus hawaiiensis TaxID=134902 RepID=UPI002018EC96|nr:eukaryotic translation initiation factor 2-alpha kinase 1 isoform X1 [Corvus hawaiiensis]XP_048176433.1 eukaryotic translation initiation factor 2-alpha kinase 1 isoform X1 [Corvus hawaiiensis]
MTSLRRPLASGARRRPGRRAGGGRRGGGGGGGGSSERLRVTRGPAPPLCRGREPLEGARRPPVRARGSRGLRAVSVPVRRGGDAPLPAADLRYKLLPARPRLPGRRFPSRVYPSGSCFIAPRSKRGHKRWPGPQSRPQGGGRAPPAAAEGTRAPAPGMWGGRRAAALLAPPPAIEYPEESPEPRFDESDVPAELRVANGSQKFVKFTSTIQNQLLLVSLLEHLCHMYTHNPVHSRCLFRIFRQAFTRTGLLSPFAFCDEFSTVRLQHNRAIAELMKAANQQILNGELDNGESHAIGEKEVLFEAQTSRYLNEFEEVARLGKGGYGKVYKVRNKLDGQFYAIKKIKIKKATRRDCMKVLREVKVLAGLQHPNIVGYHTAWMEQVQTVHPKAGKTIMELQPLSLEQESSNDHCHIQSVESDSSIIFADLTSQEKKSCDSTNLKNLGGESVQNMDVRNDFTNSNSKECVKPNKCELSIELQEDFVHNVNSLSTDVENHSTRGRHSSLDQDASTESQSSSESKSYSEECSKNEVALCGEFEVEYHLMLHIQMQLCEISLWDWIVDRNKRCNKRSEDTSSPYHLVDVRWTTKIFQEVVEGVCYIHSMGVMHRDIKPRNIFLHGSDHQVKIGDFGLACKDLLWDDADQWFQTERINGKRINGLTHTSGVGTCLYASPEQLQGSHYDFKSDMYSMGVILLELFQPFGTEMERTEVLTHLRTGQIPHTFYKKWPTQAKYVKLLTSARATERPTAAQLRDSELFHTTDQVISNLQEKVRQQEEEIEKLRETIRQLSEEQDEQTRLGSPV